MLRGNSPAKLDAKGRIKIPSVFRKYIEEKFGRDCFVTSLSGEYVRIYPMPILIEIEKKLEKLPSLNPAASRFKDRINYYGQPAGMDEQGRILIHPLLRKSSGIVGEVSVLGKITWVDIWNREKFETMVKAQPLTEGDLEALASHGI
ncbi:MAG TPA: division/cell wall cluster transcriptional repressor MraZ [Candidatus Polarisedimenticolia bacterium]